MDCSAIVLNKLLTERDLTIWSKLKLSFLDAAYSSVYSAISRHYEKYNGIPSFEELELEIREGASQKTLSTLKLIDEPDISAEVALDALIDQYTQNETIAHLDKFIDKLPLYDTDEIKTNLSNIVLALDEKTLTTENVVTMSDIFIFQTAETLSADRVFLGINNDFDSTLGGMSREEVIFIGGERGSGKSIVASNLIVNQYEAGNTALYVSIEMKDREGIERKIAILSDVCYMDLKNNRLNEADWLKVVKVRAQMFVDAEDLVEDYMRHRDRFKFEQTLIKNKKLKPDNQIIVIDDRAPTLASLDLHIGKAKARFGNKLTLVAIDYMNQVVFEMGTGIKSDQFDWKQQVLVSKGIKNLARKHGVLIMSPYQIDKDGEARFAKGILDAADIGIKMTVTPKEEGVMPLDTVKIRGGPPMKFNSPINWSTLRMSPHNAIVADKKQKPKKEKAKTDDSGSDIPWDM